MNVQGERVEQALVRVTVAAALLAVAIVTAGACRPLAKTSTVGVAEP